MVIRAAGGIDITDDGVLLILRADTKTFPHVWANPGGLILPGERPQATAQREILEELGLNVEVIVHIGTYQHMNGRALIGQYEGYLVQSSGKPTIIEPDKIQEVRRFPLHALPDSLAPFTQHYLEILRPRQHWSRFC